MHAPKNEPAASAGVMSQAPPGTGIAGGAARVQAHRWRIQHHRHVLITDTLVLAAFLVVTQWLGARWYDRSFVEIGHRTLFVSAVFIGWLIVLEIAHSRDLSLVGVQAEEYRRVLQASVWVFTVAAAFEIFLAGPVSRFQFTGFALALVGLLVGRFMLRANVRRRRRRGTYTSHVVALGELDSARTLSEYFARTPSAGYQLIGICIRGSDEIGQKVSMPTGSVPILGYKDDSALESIVLSAGADALAVVWSGTVAPETVKSIAWRMQAIDTELLVVPGLTEIAAHRLQLRPLEYLPLFVIDAPTHDAPSMVSKRILDIVLSSIGMVVALPVIALAGLAIKLDDRGPVFYRQERVGLNGKTFKIVKLRSMYVGTDATPQAEQHRHGSMFHKRTSDSCVTRVGKVLRATSIDELPQLFNVLEGSMSLVGPRPLAVGEAGTNKDFLEHRENVKPGMTGLWQVSGRSDLEDKDRVRLDVSYAANWSVMGDLVIIGRTVGAVIKRKGAF